MKLYKNLCAVLVMAFFSAAHAAQVNFELTGYVDYAGFSNPYGLSAGDTISATGTFDDSVLSGGTGVISFADFGNDMIFSVGSMTYSDTNDIFGGADLFLFEGMFDGLFYSTGDGEFDSFIDSFVGDVYLSGYWDASSLSVTAVPVPAAVWLFGMGLLSLAGLARRKSA